MKILLAGSLVAVCAGVAIYATLALYAEICARIAQVA